MHCRRFARATGSSDLSRQALVVGLAQPIVHQSESHAAFIDEHQDLFTFEIEQQPGEVAVAKAGEVLREVEWKRTAVNGEQR